MREENESERERGVKKEERKERRMSMKMDEKGKRMKEGISRG